MAKVTYIKKAGWTKRPRKCVSCGSAILEGEPYKHAQPRNRPQLLWCKNCSPRRSQLSSSKMGPLWDALDTFTTDGGDLEEVKGKVAEVVSAAEGVRDDYQEGYDNMPDGLQQASTGEEISMKIEAIDQLINDLQEEPEVEDEEEVRASLERDILIEMAEEEGHDTNVFSDEAIEDPMQRQEILNVLDLDFSTYENRVNERVEEHMKEGTDGYVEKVQEALSSFEW